MNSHTTSQGQSSEAKATFVSLIEDIKFAMLTTVTAEGELRSRPMATLKAPFEGDLWFFTADASAKVDEILNERQVGLSYAAPDKQKYVSVSGLASLVRDKSRMRELWTPAAKAWFPEGVDDPTIALLRVRVQAVEYWDSPSSKMVQLLGYLKSVTTGKPLETVGEHKKVYVSNAP
ncbi:MAG: pyridoxamine 5'-phosphate oxidase family protein [Opitutaceae bacterium]|nr:pyridoxamine 5'-phosphate oxidase family protein [Opitutaceae bacterium]